MSLFNDRFVKARADPSLHRVRTVQDATWYLAATSNETYVEEQCVRLYLLLS